mmetsp:Transcript_66943/g.143133  ORF Transcript_66943/g.143133 Transcript_66943/m.143133 type:complete len:352 (-) Transcript_66943:60-1115(-)
MTELGQHTTLNGRWRVNNKLAQGNSGSAVYVAKDAHLGHTSGWYAVKYPLKDREHSLITSMYDVRNGQCRCMGIPRIWDIGMHDGRMFMVMDLLGQTMKDLCKKYRGTLESKWPAIQVLGRLLVRRLESIHKMNIVHCDVQPRNILMDRSLVVWPYLCDFGSAVPFPGGEPKRADFGSVDFNSIHSAQGDTRGPWDDLESLGWVLCNALMGALPWFQDTATAVWKGGKLDDQQRPLICGRVAKAKAQLLEKGLDKAAMVQRFGTEWGHLATIPFELLDFLRVCSIRAGSTMLEQRKVTMGDYRHLEKVLGGKNANPEAAEHEDVRLFQALSQDAVLAPPIKGNVKFEWSAD